MAKYANIIVDISSDKLDKTFQYAVPEELQEVLALGMQVDIPFGNRFLTGYVVELTDEILFDPTKLRGIRGIHEGSIPIESRLIELAGWIRRNYGGTMNQALKTVLPVRKKTKEIVSRTVVLALERGEAIHRLAKYETGRAAARARLLRELLEEGELDYTLVTGKLGVSAAVIRAMTEQGIVTVREKTDYRNPVEKLSRKGYQLILNEEQQAAVDSIAQDLAEGRREVYLLKGVTGSGKTEVYMELIARAIEEGKQAIVLIPEIALTYQTVMRFYNRFGDQVSILNSRMSPGERYDQYIRAKNGEISIMIGPRSALFTPFSRLGLIIIDEEHETSYKSEGVPRYHARETAIYRAKQSGAYVVLGSATPSVHSYYQAMEGNYRLIELKKRAKTQKLPDCEIVDLRQEMKQGNRSILSRRLQELMEDRLEKGQQTMLFLNRRGVAGFMSCRACGYVVKCPHCDVSLSQHNNGRMVCHYCGYEEPVPKVCPSCGSKYISGFKAGTQKIEELVLKRFPQARILRMDFDTTRTKDSYETILQAFSNQEADILIGTQMIVKGHDFSNVTLVGVIAADMSLHVSDYQAAERTFQLLTQAAGRAGRGNLPGEVIIQTYDPEHYAVTGAREQDYETFYRKEIAYRRLLFYPPIWNLLVIQCSCAKLDELEQGSALIAERLTGLIKRREEKIRERNKKEGRSERIALTDQLQLVGPCDASIAKVNDIYRKVVYLKTGDYELLVACKDRIEHFTRENPEFRNVSVTYDFNPMSGF